MVDGFSVSNPGVDLDEAITEPVSPGPPCPVGGLAGPRPVGRPRTRRERDLGAPRRPHPPGPYPVHLISEPAVGMDAAGGAVSVFVPSNAGTTIAAAFRAAGGTWSPPVRISPTGETGTGPDVAVAPDGTAVAAWSAYRAGLPAVEVAFRAPGGGFGAPVVVSSGQRSLGVQAGIDSNDRAVVLYTLIDGSNRRHAYAVTGTRAGLGTPTVLSPSTQDAALADLGMGAGGRAVVAWQLASSDPNAGGAGVAIDAVRFTPGSGWSTPQVLDTGTALWNAS